MTGNANWYLTAKYGLYVTLAYEGHNVNVGGSYHDVCGCFPDGRMAESLDEFADAFDVERFADDCAGMGVDYVTFTAHHAHLYVLFPSKVVESRLPKHSSRRDVVGELLRALHARGIRLQLYIHATIGDTMVEWEREALGWHDAIGHYKRWNDFINEFFDELGARYGDEMDSYYIDMVFDTWYMDIIDRPRIRRTLRKHAPHVIITGNGEGNETLDYSSREDCTMFVADADDRLALPVQTVVCLSKTWWPTVPEGGPSAARYTPEHLFRLLALTAGANACGGGLALGASPYMSRGFEPSVQETLMALKLLLAPISESIRGTLASTSYVTPAGASIPMLLCGVAATQSPDGAREYLHVLNPPQGNALTLPPPLDGKRFLSAVMLRTGHAAALEQDETGVRITVPDAWDALGTVIRLDAQPAPAPKGPARLREVSPAYITAASDECVPGHGPKCAVDGRRDTFWMSAPGRCHRIELDLGAQYPVARVRVLPRPGVSGPELATHISAWSIHVSVDGALFRPVATGDWPRTPEEKSAEFPPMTARYVRLFAGPDEFIEGSTAVVSAAEIGVDAVDEGTEN